jgi:hypothetical protein
LTVNKIIILKRQHISEPRAFESKALDVRGKMQTLVNTCSIVAGLMFWNFKTIKYISKKFFFHFENLSVFFKLIVKQICFNFIRKEVTRQQEIG